MTGVQTCALPISSLSSAREPYPGSAEPPPSIDSPAIALGLYRSLSRAFGARSDPAALCGHLHDALALLGDPEILVFMLHGRPRGEIRIFAGPGISRSDCDYFLQFCRQDFLDTDRFIDLKAMDIRYPNFEEGRVAAGRGISSYWHCPLEDAEGRPIGTIHLGNSGNRYFTPLIATSFEELTGKAGALIASMRRDLALTVRLRSLRSLFGKFLPEAVIERLLSDDREGRLDEGRRQELAILFSDIRSFTTITERNGAEAVVQFLNHHFDAMVAPITANGGTVDKFIGDAIVAVFGMEEGGPPPCEAALRAAVAMIEAIPRVELQGLSLEGGRYRIGIGVHFGELVLGYLGSEAKTAFTVIGKTIEIAEGLESSTKAFKVDILLSEEVRSRVNSDDLVFRDLGLVEAEEGEGLHVYTVQGSAGGPRP